MSSPFDGANSVDLVSPDSTMDQNPVLSLLDQIGQMTPEHVDEALRLLDQQIHERYQRYLDPLEKQRDRLAELRAFLAGTPIKKPYQRRKVQTQSAQATQQDSHTAAVAPDRSEDVGRTVDKIRLYLEVAGPSPITSIAEGIEKTYQAVYLQLKNKPELFKRLPDNTWRLVDH